MYHTLFAGWPAVYRRGLRQKALASYLSRRRHLAVASSADETEVNGGGGSGNNEDDPINVRNTQRLHAVDTVRLKQALAAGARALWAEGWGVGLWLSSDDKVRRLNRQYRGKRKSTDILSFPFHEGLAPGELPQTTDPEQMYLGDMVVSVAYVARQLERDRQQAAKCNVENGTGCSSSSGGSDISRGASGSGGNGIGEEEEDRGVSGAMAGEFDLQRRLELLLVHGLCHLVGYDHETDGDYEAMVVQEERVMAAMGLSSPARRALERMTAAAAAHE